MPIRGTENGTHVLCQQAQHGKMKDQGVFYPVWKVEGKTATECFVPSFSSIQTCGLLLPLPVPTSHLHPPSAGGKGRHRMQEGRIRAKLLKPATGRDLFVPASLGSSVKAVLKSGEWGKQPQPMLQPPHPLDAAGGDGRDGDISGHPGTQKQRCRTLSGYAQRQRPFPALNCSPTPRRGARARGLCLLGGLPSSPAPGERRVTKPRLCLFFRSATSNLPSPCKTLPGDTAVALAQRQPLHGSGSRPAEPGWGGWGWLKALIAFWGAVPAISAFHQTPDWTNGPPLAHTRWLPALGLLADD